MNDTLQLGYILVVYAGDLAALTGWQNSTVLVLVLNKQTI